MYPEVPQSLVGNSIWLNVGFPNEVESLTALTLEFDC